MAQILHPDLSKVKDEAAKEVLIFLLEKFNKIEKLPPVTENTKQIAIVINKITGSL